MIPISWGLCASAAALVAGMAGGYLKGQHDKANELTVDWQAQQLRQAADFAGRLKDANTELERLRAADRAKDVTYETSIRDINRRHSAALVSLRDRPERPAVPASGAGVEAAAGSLGAVVSRRDAEALVNLAARADELRAALYRCQGGDVATEGTRLDH